MNSPLQISFGSSTSPKYDQAVSLASSLPGYHCQGEGRNGNHHITWSYPGSTMPSGRSSNVSCT